MSVLIILFLGCFVYFVWESFQYVPDIRLKFVVTKARAYIQMLPNTTNSSSGSLQQDQVVYIHWEQQYNLRILVIVYNRAPSLLRLLKSLNEAEYFNDSVKLEVWIDRSANGSVDTATLTCAKDFVFRHGVYQVITHPKHVGIFGQWLSTWRIWRNNSEIVVILEDDLTVSPYFYKFLKLAHEKYDGNPNINGYALQSVSIKHGTNSKGFIHGPRDDPVFLYPVIGTWGFSPNTKNWADFIDWFSVKYRERDFHPYVPGNVVTVWYKTFQQSGKASEIWSIWHIYYAWQKQEYTLYTNFEGNSISTNYTTYCHT